MTPGTYPNLPADQYHADREAVSASMLKLFARTPAHAYAALSQPEEDEESITLFLGTCIHQVFLEPTKPLPGIVVRPLGLDFRSKEGKEWRDKQTARIVTQEEFDTISGCRDSLNANQWLRKYALHPKSQFEVSVWGVGVKARIDLVPPTPSNWLGDLKTCRVGEAAPEQWPKVMASRWYHCQAAWYLDVWNEVNWTDKRSEFVFIAVEKEPPFAVGIYQVGPEALARGRELNAARLETFRRCRETGIWPAYASEPVVSELPKWA